MTHRLRLIKLETASQARTGLAEVHRRLGIIDGVPDRTDPVQRMADAIGPRPQDQANFIRYLDALEAFGRDEVTG